MWESRSVNWCGLQQMAVSQATCAVNTGDLSLFTILCQYLATLHSIYASTCLVQKCYRSFTIHNTSPTITDAVMNTQKYSQMVFKVTDQELLLFPAVISKHFCKFLIIKPSQDSWQKKKVITFDKDGLVVFSFWPGRFTDSTLIQGITIPSILCSCHI